MDSDESDAADSWIDSRRLRKPGCRKLLGDHPEISSTIDDVVSILSGWLDIFVMHWLYGIVPLFCNGIRITPTFADIALETPLESDRRWRVDIQFDIEQVAYSFVP